MPGREPLSKERKNGQSEKPNKEEEGSFKDG
jgi:hypothetical protein